MAAFLGGFRRGPVGTPVRVESWRDVLGAFGGPDGSASAPYAVRGFFENGGRTAWLLRVAGPGRTARAGWTVGEVAGFAARRYEVVAGSPGAWANGGRITVRFRSSTVAGHPAVDVRVAVPGEPTEWFPGLAPDALESALAASRLVRLVPVEPAGAADPAAPPGPITRTWELTLAGGGDSPPDRDAYRDAVVRLVALPEPSLVALPDLGTDLAGPDHRELVRELLAAVRPLLDRLVVLDVPPELSAVDGAVAFAGELTASGDGDAAATAAVYHPPLLVPEGNGARTVPASGHVLGVIARLDAERGAHHTPANAVLLEAVDLAVALPPQQRLRLADAGIDLLRCTRGRGLTVWGGRTLSPVPRVRYIAHRRLLHLLVRAIRRVAAPLVFDVNSPELRLALVRALTSVLLAAFRAGALAGARPDEAFRVVCDDSNNPPGQDPATTVCEVAVAPAVPMEFIRLRLILGADRGLEVIEA
ncbi:phage tail sheath subtilisin-like domain-containing protein [Streptomyces clavuligerus]|uniref:phage tail sheath subtilisin-like domain-containing protein n=1 Tax=Streptomyces clavuligerus TaxID=1901 RepID=UPI0027DAF0AC|nr:phage tail sheath subtilisin-like domain-containing protein [Streptomyces clavuligerus]